MSEGNTNWKAKPRKQNSILKRVNSVEGTKKTVCDDKGDNVHFASMRKKSEGLKKEI